MFNLQLMPPTPPSCTRKWVKRKDRAGNTTAIGRGSPSARSMSMERRFPISTQTVPPNQLSWGTSLMIMRRNRRWSINFNLTNVLKRCWQKRSQTLPVGLQPRPSTQLPSEIAISWTWQRVLRLPLRLIRSSPCRRVSIKQFLLEGWRGLPRREWQLTCYS